MTRRSRGGYRRGKYWYFKYKKDNGAWSEHATHATDRKKADSVHATFLRELEAGRLPNEYAQWTLGEAADRRLSDRKLRVTQGTFASECTITRNILRVLGANAKLLRISDIQTIKRYETERLREGRCAKTINNEVLVVAGILREANLWHRVAPFYKPLKVNRSDVGDALTKDETSRLIQIARAAGAGAVAPFTALLSEWTGMRINEIRQLRLRSIHLDAPKPFLQVLRSTTKTNKGARYVALNQIASWAIDKLLVRAKSLGAAQPDHFLLPTLREKHTKRSDPLYGRAGYDPTHPQSSWTKEWNAVRRSAGILHRRFHDLRHTYITRAAEAGVPLPVTQAQVGHMSTQMVAHYTHICQAAIHQAAEQIDKHSSDLLAYLESPVHGDETFSLTGQP